MQNEGGVFTADKIIGIIIMVLSAVCGLCGLVGAGILGAVGASLPGMAASGGQGAPTTQEAAAAAGLLGMGAAVFAVIVIVVSALNIVSGYGIMKSARWGFLFSAILNGVWILFNLPNFVANIIGIIFSAAILVYCILRLTGNLGPKPV